jgi:serine carboxypeptidase-like clade II
MKRVPAGYDPCTEAYVTKYFNRGDVPRARPPNRTRQPKPYTPSRSALRSQSLSQRPF